MKLYRLSGLKGEALLTELAVCTSDADADRKVGEWADAWAGASGVELTQCGWERIDWIDGYRIIVGEKVNE